MAARRIDDPTVPRWCRGAGERQLVGLLSPDGLSLTYRDRASARVGACDAVRVGRRWVRCSIRFAPSTGPRAVERAGGALGSCRHRDRWTAFFWARSRSPATSYALVARRGFWVAYSLGGEGMIRISSSWARAPRDRVGMTVVFVNRNHRVIERRRVVGVVAG